MTTPVGGGKVGPNVQKVGDEGPRLLQLANPNISVISRIALENDWT